MLYAPCWAFGGTITENCEVASPFGGMNILAFGAGESINLNTAPGRFGVTDTTLSSTSPEKLLRDEAFIVVSVEVMGFVPRTLTEIVSGLAERI